jgi:hypothetical protein
MMMKTSGLALSNMAFKGLEELLNEGGLSRSDGYDDRPDARVDLACDEGQFWLDIKRATGQRKKRIVIDISYPQAKA